MQSNGFHKALLMFSRMFAHPLFDIKLMEKEINAVNSENEKNLNQDSWRQNEILKALSNEMHPYHQFSTGNKETLHDFKPEVLHKKLTDFFEKYYIPSGMKLVVLSKKFI
jgi:insulysin